MKPFDITQASPELRRLVIQSRVSAGSDKVIRDAINVALKRAIQSEFPDVAPEFAEPKKRAKPKCVKGQPCGYSCISQNIVCRSTVGKEQATALVNSVKNKLAGGNSTDGLYGTLGINGKLDSTKLEQTDENYAKLRKGIQTWQRSYGFEDDSFMWSHDSSHSLVHALVGESQTIRDNYGLTGEYRFVSAKDGYAVSDKGPTVAEEAVVLLVDGLRAAKNRSADEYEKLVSSPNDMKKLVNEYSDFDWMLRGDEKVKSEKVVDDFIRKVKEQPRADLDKAIDFLNWANQKMLKEVYGEDE